MKVLRVVSTLIVISLVAVSAFAAQPAKGQPYIGAKLGLVMPDGSGIDDAVNLGAVLGATLSHVQAGSLGVEGELTTSIVDGDISGGGDWSITSLAGYGVFRSDGPLYFKGKAGLVYWDADVNFGFGASGSDDDINLSIGIGGGYKISSKAAVEVEYTILDSDFDFLSAGFIVNF